MISRRAFLAASAAVVAAPVVAAEDAADDVVAGGADVPGLDVGYPEKMVEVGFEFAKRAPFSIVHEAVLPARPRVVFDVLADPAPWPRWLSSVQKVEYRKPFGVGTVRDVTTNGLGVIREHFFCWDEGERFAFSVSSSTSPLLTTFYEDYVLKPVDGGNTRLIWTVACQAKPWAFFAGPALMSVFKVNTPGALEKLKLEVKARKDAASTVK